MNTNSKDKGNIYIYILKAIAIFSVVCAHSTPLMDSNSKINVFSSQMLDYLGTFGVPVFFCISGYLFAGNTRTWGEFWKRKVFTLFIPWICCETLLWLYVVLRKGGISITAWLLFLLGYHHTTYAEYMAQLQQRGKEKLAENVSITSFEGETETTIMFQYGKDFFNGDIVQIANEYGHETKARILEIVRSEDKDGYSVYPTFKTIEQEGA